MTAALIGLIGVVAGAVLTGVVNDVLEGRKRRVLGRAVGQLISDELEVDLILADVALEHGAWPSDLSTEAYKANLKELAFFVSGPLLTALTTAYANLEEWNRAHDAKDPFDPEGQQANLDSIKSAKNALDTELASGTTTARLFGWVGQGLGIFALVALVVAVVALVVALVVPRPDLSDESIASALQTELGPRAFVECDSVGDDWRCTVDELTPSRDECLSANLSSPAALASTSHALVAVQSGSTPACKVTPREVLNVTRDPDQIVGIPAKILGNAARKEVQRRLRQATIAKLPKESLVGEALDAIGPP